MCWAGMQCAARASGIDASRRSLFLLTCAKSKGIPLNFTVLSDV